MKHSRISLPAGWARISLAGVLAVLWGLGSAAYAQHPARVAPPVVRPIRPIPIRPIYPIYRPYYPYFYRPLFQPPFALGPYWRYQSPWISGCGIFAYSYSCNVLPIYPPMYFFGTDNGLRAQIALKDGTIYNVTDYWAVDDQLHFRTLEDGGTKSVEHVVPLDQLDQPKTIQLDTLRGFRFVLRDEPIEDYLQHHPETGQTSAPDSSGPG